MTTIRVMAWPQRAKLNAHATKATTGKPFQYSTASCVDVLPQWSPL